jgi:4-amino-4-deoxy-L-arabinose transferase-like glycosyltransferase
VGWTPRGYVLLVLALCVLHGVLAAALPLSGDEAYYWDCSRHPNWSTFDQPPLVIWGVIPFRLVLGDTALAVRAPALVASGLLGLFLLPLVRRLGGGAREAAWTYLVLHGAPLFFLGAFYNATDSAMITAYVAATWAAVALAQGERRAWWGFGVAVGIGFLAKFPVVLVLPALLPALARREVRAHLRTATPYLAALLSALLTLPVWLWAAQHDWVNFAFQLKERHEVPAFTLTHLGEFLGASALLASPPLFVALVLAWWRGWRRREPGWAALLLAVASPFAVFGFVSLWESVGGHWGAPGIVLGVVALALTRPRSRALVASGVAFGLAVALVVVALAVSVDRVPWAKLPLSEKARGRVLDALAPAIGNGRIVAQVERRLAPDELLATESYTDVHELAFLSHGRLHVFLANINQGRHGLESLYWYRPDELMHRDFLFVTERRGLTDKLGAIFASVSEEAPIIVTRAGHVVRRVRVLRCRDLLEPAPAFTRLAANQPAS